MANLKIGTPKKGVWCKGSKTEPGNLSLTKIGTMLARCKVCGEKFNVKDDMLNGGKIILPRHYNKKLSESVNMKLVTLLPIGENTLNEKEVVTRSGASYIVMPLRIGKYTIYYAMINGNVANDGSTPWIWHSEQDAMRHIKNKWR